MNPKKRGWSGVISAALCSLMFVVSLCLPALWLAREPAADPTGNYVGAALLMLGWIEALGGSTSGLAWLANPCFGLGILCLLFRRFGWAVVIFTVGFGLTCASFGIRTVVIDEGGSTNFVVGFGPGFWLWHLSYLVGVLASFLLWMTSLSQTKTSS